MAENPIIEDSSIPAPSLSSSTVVDRPTSPSPTAYSFTASELRQRGVAIDTSSSSNTSASSNPHAEVSSSPSSSDVFECNICIDTATIDPVVTLCGHLYCWECLHHWMTSGRSMANTCPVCKSLISNDKIIPIFVRGGSNSDPRTRPTDLPNRPQPQRQEAPVNQGQSFFQGLFNNNNGGGSGGIQFSAGFGPLGLLSLFGFPMFHLQFGQPGVGVGAGGHGGSTAATGEQQQNQQYGVPNNNNGALSHQQREFISRLFMMISILIIISILFG